MKFSRTEMITRAQAEIERRKAAHAVAVAEAESRCDQARADWARDHLPAYNEFANTIKRKARKGQPIVKDDIPRTITNRYGDSLNVFNQPRPDQAKPNVEGLERLISLLNAVTDDEITSTGLVSLGYRDLSRLFV